MPRVLPAVRRRLNGAAVRVLRETLGLSSKDFARNVGISGPYLSNIELRGRQPRPQVIAAIARELGCSVAAIAPLEQPERIGA